MQVETWLRPLTETMGIFPLERDPLDVVSLRGEHRQDRGATGVPCGPGRCSVKGLTPLAAPAPPRDFIPFGLPEWTVWRVVAPPDLVVNGGPQGGCPPCGCCRPPPGLGQ